MEKEKFYSNKIKTAVHLIFFKRGKKPGVKEWELKEKIGEKYVEVLAQLNEFLKELDLEVVKIKEENELFSEKAEARYIARLKGNLSLTEAKLCGWRIDNLAALAISLSYLIVNQGKALKKDLEKILEEKIGKWKAANLIDSFIKAGYLNENEEKIISIGWRTKAEVDLKELIKTILEA
jgi:hypothetical protein